MRVPLRQETSGSLEQLVHVRVVRRGLPRRQLAVPPVVLVAHGLPRIDP